MATYTITKDTLVGAMRTKYEQITLPIGTVCKKTGTSNIMGRVNAPVVSCTVNGVEYTDIVLDVPEEGSYYEGGGQTQE